MRWGEPHFDSSCTTTRSPGRTPALAIVSDGSLQRDGVGVMLVCHARLNAAGWEPEPWAFTADVGVGKLTVARLAAAREGVSGAQIDMRPRVCCSHLRAPTGTTNKKVEMASQAATQRVFLVSGANQVRIRCLHDAGTSQFALGPHLLHQNVLFIIFSPVRFRGRDFCFLLFLLSSYNSSQHSPYLYFPSKGIGYAVVEGLARLSSNNLVLLCSRDKAKGDEALKKMAEKHKEVAQNVRVLQLDIDDDKSVQAAAQEVKQQFGGLDVLINNAAIAFKGPRFDEEVDGLEGERGACVYLPAVG